MYLFTKCKEKAINRTKYLVLISFTYKGKNDINLNINTFLFQYRCVI